MLCILSFVAGLEAITFYDWTINLNIESLINSRINKSNIEVFMVMICCMKSCHDPSHNMFQNPAFAPYYSSSSLAITLTTHRSSRDIESGRGEEDRICECESVLVLSLGEDTLTLRDIDQVSEAGRLDTGQKSGTWALPLISEHKCSALYFSFIVSSEKLPLDNKGWCNRYSLYTQTGRKRGI